MLTELCGDQRLNLFEPLEVGLRMRLGGTARGIVDSEEL
jgi:hypothetical protein